MTKKIKSKTTDTTPNHVKNTKTGAKDEDGVSLRWYHIVATVVVLGLVVIAIIRIFSRFDPTLINSQYTIRYATGCTTTIAGPIEKKDIKYRYAGIKEGDMLGDGGIVKEEGDAYVKIVELGANKVKIKVRDLYTNEWSEKEIRYGQEFEAYYGAIADCMPGISFTINR
ncbi:MAG: hypothetical protein Q4D22_03330 [Candidatus Saccharibacteria bacterium]|nr:hypothetical protein [Candidatus Saccharibacteria bacterium]